MRGRFRAASLKFVKEAVPVIVEDHGQNGFTNQLCSGF